MFGKEFDILYLELKKNQSQSSWGKKQTFAGLLYTYLRFVIFN